MINATPNAHDYWTTCATEWENVADAAYEVGDLPTEEFFHEQAQNAEYINKLLD